MTQMDVEFYLSGAPGIEPNVDYGDYVLEVDIWQESLNGIGRWQVIVDPSIPVAVNWPSVSVDDKVHIRIDDGTGVVTMMRGYVDDVLPFLAPTGHHIMLYKLTGRNRGMDLAQHYVSAEYRNTAVATIIGNAAGSLLRLIPSELDHVGPAAATINYEVDRTYLADAIRELLSLINYDFYVDNSTFTGNANLNIFPVGTNPSGVTLRSIPGTAGNEILRIDPFGEEVGFNLKNYVEVHAGGLSDHWTEFNIGALGWVNAAGTTVTNDTALFLNGRGAIRATNTSGGIGGIDMYLDFSAAGGRYGYGPTGIRQLDMSEPSMASFNYLVHNTWVGIPPATRNVRIRLRDNLNREIQYQRAVFAGLAKCFNCTDQPDNDEWRKVEFPVGDECGIEAAPPAATSKGEWAYTAGAAFNWNNINRIRFLTTINTNTNTDYFVIDGLQIPNVEVFSVAQDATSITNYGQRMKDFFRPDIKNQIELDNCSAALVARLKDPKETLRIVAIGQTGTPFAAETVEIIAPTFGIMAATKYRILRLHHRLVKSSDESDLIGFTFTTEYDLVRNVYQAGGTQYVDHTSVIGVTDPTQYLMRKTRLKENQRRRSPAPRLVP